VFQIVDFSSINDLKFTYVHLQFKKIFPGVIPPDPHDKGEGRGGKEKEGKKGREGRGGKGGMGWGEPPENKSWLRPWFYASFMPEKQVVRSFARHSLFVWLNVSDLIYLHSTSKTGFPLFSF
jgi:hypothetical protein